MKKTELIKYISQKAGLSQKKSAEILDLLLLTIKDELSQNGNFTLSRFGRFFVKKRKAKNYYNISKKEICLLPEKKSIYFKNYFGLRHSTSRSNCVETPVIQQESSVLFPTIEELGYRTTPSSNLAFTSVQSAVYKSSSTTQSHKYKRDRSCSKENHYKYQTSAGNIILPNQLNLGTRVVKKDTTENTKIEYVGTIEFEYYDSPVVEINSFPAALFPVNGTPIINYHSYSGITGGVSEPLLFHALKELMEINPDIKVLQNISIPIKGRNYGYKPDIAIIWASKKIFVDVEIDEPYDIKSRKPIHYKECSDALRNAYLTSNGWTVLRFAEEQIVKDITASKEYVFKVLAILAQDKGLYNNRTIESIPRWSYEEAKEQEKKNYRETYLGIERTAETVSSDICIDDDYCLPESFNFIKPGEDIIDDRYENLREDILEIKHQFTYIIIKSKVKGYEYLSETKNLEFLTSHFYHSVRLCDVVEEVWIDIPLCEIDSYKGKSNIFKENSDKKVGDKIYDCIINCNPIWLQYNKAYGGFISERHVLYLSRWYKAYDDDNRNKFPAKDLIESVAAYNYEAAIEDVYYNFFSGLCLYRKEIRTFASDRVYDLKAFDCYKPAISYDVNTAWEMLKLGYGEIAEIIINNMPKHIKNSLLCQGNLCNALVMQGRLQEAKEIYLSHPSNAYVKDAMKTWSQVNFEDIEYFIENGIEKDYFYKIKEELSEHWHE